MKHIIDQACRLLGAIAVTLGGTLLTASAHAGEPLHLQAIMKEMGRAMQVITDGIAREDWALIAAAAPRISAHDQPPQDEKIRIITFMGPGMGQFKAFDTETGEAALSLEQAARRADAQQVIDSFRQVQTGCMNCHQQFRSKIKAHFYGVAPR